LRLHRARPQRRPAHLRPRDGHVPRPRGRDRGPRRPLRGAEASLHRGADVRGAAPRPGRRPRPQAGRAPGRRAEPDQSAVRLLVPPALSALPRRALRRRDAAAATPRRRGPRRRVPLPARGLAPDGGGVPRQRRPTPAGGRPRRVVPVWLAAARRFFTLLGAIVAAIFLCAVSIGLILGTTLNRSIAVAFEAFGCLLLLFAFFVGNRGPVRTKGDAHPFIGPRFLRWATPE